MNGDVGVCPWEACEAPTSEGVKLCATHIDEVSKASGSLASLVIMAGQALGWPVVGDAVRAVLMDASKLLADSPNAPQQTRIATQLVPLVEREPELGANALVNLARAGRLDDQKLGEAFALELVRLRPPEKL